MPAPFHCRTPAAFKDALRRAKNARAVVIDGHAAPDIAGIGRFTDNLPELAPDELGKSIELHACELLIIGACHQGRYVQQWRGIAPNAIIIASGGEVDDKTGCVTITRMLHAAQTRSDRIDATWVEEHNTGDDFEIIDVPAAVTA